MESYTMFAFIFVLMLGNAMALQCRNCISSKSFDECDLMGPIAECTATIVNSNHAAFKSDNPTLPQGNWTEFKCYRIQVSRLHPNNSDTGLRGYARGCTFANTTFCSGWISSLNLTSCSTCTTDNCEQYPPDVPQTTTNQPGTGGSTTTNQPGTGGSTTTNQPGTGGSTTTSKPGNGAGVFTSSSLTSLGCLSILLALAAR